jgi:hypothetical protein
MLRLTKVRRRKNYSPPIAKGLPMIRPDSPVSPRPSRQSHKFEPHVVGVAWTRVPTGSRSLATVVDLGPEHDARLAAVASSPAAWPRAPIVAGVVWARGPSGSRSRAHVASGSRVARAGAAFAIRRAKPGRFSTRDRLRRSRRGVVAPPRTIRASSRAADAGRSSPVARGPSPGAIAEQRLGATRSQRLSAPLSRILIKRI